MKVRIALRTTQGKILREWTVWDMASVIGAFIGLFLFFSSPPSNPMIANWGQWIAPVVLVGATLRLSITLVMSLKSIGVHYYKNTMPRTSKLIRSKIQLELKNTVLNSTEDIGHELDGAQRDEQTLIKASKDNLITNPDIAPLEWLPNDNPIVKVLRTIPANTYDLQIEREKLLKNLVQITEGTANTKPIIKFVVAAVQPSIILAASRLITNNNLGDWIETHIDTVTGPEAVNKAISLRKDPSLGDASVVFVAPLSAVLTKPSKNSNENPRTFFSPVCSLLREPQELLLVENGKRTPIRAAKLFYYDNSTAEEYVAHSHDAFHGLMVQKPITDYESYKQLLYGIEVNAEAIQPGDGVVVWPPLTKHFISRDLEDGHYVDEGILGRSRTYSRIMLYADKRLFDTNNDNAIKFARLFVRLLIFEMRLLRENKDGWFFRHMYLNFPGTEGYKILKGYQSQFKNMLAPN